MQSKLYDDLPVQDLQDILEEFYKYDAKVTKDMDDEQGICAITRLVTIIEQFFRGVMCEAFDNNRTTIPEGKQFTDDKISKKQLDLLLPTMDKTKNYLASMMYPFQQIKIIETEMKKLDIEYCEPQDKKYINDLFNLRHNIIHTVAAQTPYYEDIRNYYNLVENMFHMVLDGLNIPKWSFYSLKEKSLMALDDFERIIEYHELALGYLKQFDTVDAYAEMSFVCLNIYNIKDAKKFINIALNIDANHADANYCNGLVLQIENDPKNADQFFQKTIKANPSHVHAYIERIKYLHATGRVNECIRVLNEAIDYMPSIPDFYFELGLVLQKSDKISEAKKYFAKGDKLIINFVKSHSNNIWKRDSLIDMLVEYKRKEALHKCGIGT